MGRIRNLAWVAGGLTIAALVVAVAFIGTIWQQQRLRIAFKELSQIRALETAERRFRATFEQVAVGIAHVTPDGHWMRFNQRLCEIVGYSRVDLMELTFRDLTPPGDTNDMTAMKRLLTGTIPHDHWEQRCRRQDGSNTWIAITASLVRDAAGRPDYFITVVEDISARKAAEGRVTHMTRIYRMLSETKQCIIRTKTRMGLFDEICRVTVTHGCFLLVCIRSVPPSMVIHSHYGPAANLLNQPESQDWNLSLQQIMTNVWNGQPIYFDIDSGIEPYMNQCLAPLSDFFHRYGIYSSAIFPLREAEHITHVFIIHAPHIGYFDSDMVQLLDEMAFDISVGLENLSQTES